MQAKRKTTADRSQGTDSRECQISRHRRNTRIERKNGVWFLVIGISTGRSNSRIGLRCAGCVGSDRFFFFSVLRLGGMFILFELADTQIFMTSMSTVGMSDGNVVQ